MNACPTKIRLLDLFCCAGGAGRGYAMAGFEVTGVDIDPQPNYPFRFIQCDAIEYLYAISSEYDLIHGSPPCQGYSPHVTSRTSKWVTTRGKDEPRLIAALRHAMIQSKKPYVIENVMGARQELRANLILCGSMFGLPISRHRLFETSFPVIQPSHPRCSGIARRFAESRGWEYRDMTVTGKGRRAGTSARWQEIMGLSGTMTQREIAESIPPAYTRYVASQFLSQ